LAKLEAELMLLGIWKNIQELEDNVTLEEMQIILDAAREKDYQHQKFLAALKGINLDEQSGADIRSKFDAVQERANARLRGENAEDASWESLGLDIETD
jgi:hypothetical protein